MQKINYIDGIYEIKNLIFYSFVDCFVFMGWSCSIFGEIISSWSEFSGQANFRFELADKQGTVHWRNGENVKSTISVPVQNGRYVVLLGGQGMNPIPDKLFLEHNNLFIRVFADLNDGSGIAI